MMPRVAHDSASALQSVLTDLSEIVHVTYLDDPSWLVAVQFRFDEGHLQVEVNPDDGTVEVVAPGAPPGQRCATWSHGDSNPAIRLARAALCQLSYGPDLFPRSR